MDKAAIGLSLFCTVHCLLAPIAIILLPALSALSIGDEQFHRLLLLAVFPISFIALAQGCRRHRNIHVALAGILGLAILACAAFFGHDIAGESGEKIATLIGTAVIALAHFKNRTLCLKV